jgi:hypothetical protein
MRARRAKEAKMSSAQIFVRLTYRLRNKEISLHEAQVEEMLQKFGECF